MIIVSAIIETETKATRLYWTF